MKLVLFQLLPEHLSTLIQKDIMVKGSTGHVIILR